jgi:hypothetical protein
MERTVELGKASPLSRPENLRRFDETGGAQPSDCEHSSEKQIDAQRITQATSRMCDTLHFARQTGATPSGDVASASELLVANRCRSRLLQNNSPVRSPTSDA